MIKKVESKSELKEFIYFIKDLYKENKFYINPIFASVYKELKEQVLKKKKYTAFLVKRDDKIVGRCMFTYSKSKAREEEICYYSYLDFIDDDSVVDEIFAYIYADMKKNNISYLEGTYAPYDPDTRRGILVEGFSSSSTIFLSYNSEYYGRQLERIGLKNILETICVRVDINDDVRKLLNRTCNIVEKRCSNARIDDINFLRINREIKDIHKIFSIATNEYNYTAAPSMETIKNVARTMRIFLNAKLIKIAREKDTNEPIGFCLVFKDFNQVLKVTKGKFRLLKILQMRRHIDLVKGTIQYVVPKYQNTGLIYMMYKSVLDNLDKMGIKSFEAGTIPRVNIKSAKSFDRFNGYISKVFRIYGKEI